MNSLLKERWLRNLLGHMMSRRGLSLLFSFSDLQFYIICFALSSTRLIVFEIFLETNGPHCEDKMGRKRESCDFHHHKCPISLCSVTNLHTFQCLQLLERPAFPSHVLGIFFLTDEQRSRILRAQVRIIPGFCIYIFSQFPENFHILLPGICAPHHN